MSSKTPSIIASGLPPNHVISPCSRSSARRARSTNSSAGTNTKLRSTSASRQAPVATTWAKTLSAIPTCVWWPQACTAPVAGSASGWAGEMTASSSATTAMRRRRGSSGAAEGSVTFTPVVEKRSIAAPSPCRCRNCSTRRVA